MSHFQTPSQRSPTKKTTTERNQFVRIAHSQEPTCKCV